MKNKPSKRDLFGGEIFKTINDPSLNGRYMISNYGRIWDSHRGRIKKPTLSGGALRMEVQIKKKRVRRSIHRLVLKEFFGPPPKYRFYVDHINGNKTDNRFENLRYVDYWESSACAFDRDRTTNYPDDQDLQEGENWEYVDNIDPRINRKFLVTDRGRVWSLLSARWIKPHLGPKGYLRVTLSRETTDKDGNDIFRKRFRVHRLVMQAFVGLPNFEDPTVDHLNEIKTDNRLENLEWVTRSENSKRWHRKKRLTGSKITA